MDKFDLRGYFKFEHEVVYACWAEDKGVWQISVKNLRTGMVSVEEAEVFINNGGFLKYVFPHSYLEILRVDAKEIPVHGGGRIFKACMTSKVSSPIQLNTIPLLITRERKWRSSGLAVAVFRSHQTLPHTWKSSTHG